MNADHDTEPPEAPPGETDGAFMAELEAEINAGHAQLSADGAPNADLAQFARSVWRRQSEIAAIRAYAAKATARLQREIDRIENWYGPQITRLVHDRTDGGKRKSIATPYGRIGLRHQAQRIEWAPEQNDALVAWAEDNCAEAVSRAIPDIRKTIRKKELLEAMRNDDLHPPGVTVTPAGDALYIQPAKELDEPVKEETDGS